MAHRPLALTKEKFTGQRLDDTGLYYYGARYYDAGIGRFVSADPIVQTLTNPQALNRYSYVWGNPLKYVDPTGLFTRRELLAYGVDSDVIAKWESDAELWEFIYQANIWSEFTRTWGGTTQKYRFDIVFESPCGNQCPEGAEVDPILRLVLRQTGLEEGKPQAVDEVLDSPGSLSYENEAGKRLDIVVGYGKAFEAKGDAYLLRKATLNTAAAGLDAVATMGQALSVFPAGCDPSCAGSLALTTLTLTGNPYLAGAVLVGYQVGTAAEFWTPRFREAAYWLRHR